LKLHQGTMARNKKTREVEEEDDDESTDEGSSHSENESLLEQKGKPKEESRLKTDENDNDDDDNDDDDDDDDNEDDEDNDDDNNDTDQGDDPIANNNKKKVHRLSMAKTEDFNETLRKRGVVYVARIPPRMTPTKIKSLLSEFGEITRVYLVEEDATVRKRRKKLNGGSSGGKRYLEGWVEFASKKIAKHVARALNNSQISNYKRSQHYGTRLENKYLPLLFSLGIVFVRLIRLLQNPFISFFFLFPNYFR
jgi:ESF2/ABP1 family protein